jgi:ABC-type dipeptide/oligopeptide/nickel transport system permease component
MVRDLPRFALISALVAIPASIGALLVGVGIGFLRRLGRIPTPSLVVLVASVPMFVFAILLQALGLSLNELLGIRLFQVAYVGGVRTPILLPIIAAMLPMAALVTRMVGTELDRQLKADYVGAAKARGLSRSSVVLRHAGAGAIVHLESLLPRVGSTSLAMMFIIERIFNLPGLSTMLFNFAFDRHYHRFPRIIETVTRHDGATYLRSSFGGGLWVLTVQLQLLVACVALIAILYTIIVLSSLLVTRALRRAAG